MMTSNNHRAEPNICPEMKCVREYKQIIASLLCHDSAGTSFCVTVPHSCGLPVTASSLCDFHWSFETGSANGFPHVFPNAMSTDEQKKKLLWSFKPDEGKELCEAALHELNAQVCAS